MPVQLPGDHPGNHPKICISRTYQGKFTQGVVILENGVQLPEGTTVKVEPIDVAVSEPGEDALYRLSDLAAPTGIPDLARNIDHYLYSHPKVNDADR